IFSAALARASDRSVGLARIPQPTVLFTIVWMSRFAQPLLRRRSRAISRSGESAGPFAAFASLIERYQLSVRRLPVCAASKCRAIMLACARARTRSSPHFGATLIRNRSSHERCSAGPSWLVIAARAPTVEALRERGEPERRRAVHLALDLGLQRAKLAKIGGDVLHRARRLPCWRERHASDARTCSKRDDRGCDRGQVGLRIHRRHGLHGSRRCAGVNGAC